MLEKRSHVIVVSSLLGILGAAIPLLAMALMSWHLAKDKELQFLDLVAGRSLLRAEAAFADARTTLDTLNATELVPCSPAHIARMRQLTIDSLYVSEIGYFDGDRLACTSWGPVEGTVPRTRPDYVTPDGMGVTLRMKPAVSRGTAMAALENGSYNVLILPIRFVDVFLPDGIALALLNDRDQIIDTLGPVEPDEFRTVARQGVDGLDGTKLYAVVRRGDLSVVTMEARKGLDSQFLSELALLLPVGAFIAAFIVGIVVWLSRKRLSPQAEMEIALRKHEFIVHYQPIIAFASGACIGAEALVRWRQPDGTMVRPDLFIPLAEETGLIRPMTDQIVEMVLRDLDSLLVSDRALHIAINVCADDLKTGRIVDFIDARLRDTDILPNQIWIEVTERGLVDIDAARVTLNRARALGHAIAIDDFGTGYSSLQYLGGLPVDALKIDKSFVDTLGLDTANRSVIDHVIAMAHELGLETVAEGVETEAQAAWLRENGVTYGQGWLYAKAMPAAEFIAFCRRPRSRAPRSAARVATR